MQYVRFGMMVLMCVCLSGIAWAADEEAKEDVKSMRDTAKAVLAGAKIDLTKAIETAQAKIPRGKPIYAAAAVGSKSLRFDVFLLVDGTLSEVQFDAGTGKVLTAENQADDLEDDLDDAKKVLAASKITFAEAIATAKTKVAGGKPFEIETELEEDKFMISVLLLAGDKMMLVQIDAVTGQVLEVEEETE